MPASQRHLNGAEFNVSRELFEPRGPDERPRQLAERSAKVLGVEPYPIQAEKNRAAEAVPGLSFVEVPGQALPTDDGFMDGVFFRNSLHHVPREHMGGALAEATRMLKPETGFLYVLEPMLAGSRDHRGQDRHW